ncbi:MAG: hypothetical protein JNK04_25390 [Myxococcales bacterium]|nr:hypothetical protein [Myxococcales bacterium]
MRAPSRWPSPALLSLLLVVVAGCSHPATREECLIIFNKSAELELKKQNTEDPRLIEHRTQAFMEAGGEELIQKCIGRAMTKSAIECVKRAESAAAVDQSLY